MKCVVKINGRMGSKKVAPRVKIIFRTIIIDMVPTIGTMAFLTKEDIIKDREATTSIDSNPIEKAPAKRQKTSSAEKTLTPLLNTIKSPFPNNSIPDK